MHGKDSGQADDARTPSPCHVWSSVKALLFARTEATYLYPVTTAARFTTAIRAAASLIASKWPSCYICMNEYLSLYWCAFGRQKS